MKLPYAAEADAELSDNEINMLRDAYQRAQSTTGEVPSQIKFNYAWGLVRSRTRKNQQLGVKLFKEIYDEDPGRHRECIYYLALGHYRLGQYTLSKKYNEELLRSEPDNLQALSLENLIRQKVNEESILAVVVTSGAVAAIAAGLAFLLRKK